MKLGLPTNYTCQFPNSYYQQSLANCTTIDRNGRSIAKGNTNTNKKRFRDKFNNNRPTPIIHRTTEDDPYRVTVGIGDKEFTGIGLTMQSAKHDAAAK